MTKRELKLQKIREAEKRRRQLERSIRLERQVSQISGFIMSFGEVLDTLIPLGIATWLAKRIVRRCIERHAHLAA